MVNEERLQHMIKMAAFDARDGKECRPMIQYARKDYVSLQLLRSFVEGTIAFMLLIVMWALYSMETIMKEINTMDIVGFLVSLALKYLIFMLVYLLATYLIFNMRYTTGRKKVKKYYNNVKKVNKLYEREDRLKTPGNKDWE